MKDLVPLIQKELNITLQFLPSFLCFVKLLPGLNINSKTASSDILAAVEDMVS
jgi:hypothetical protein